MVARGFSPFTGLPKRTGVDTSRHGFTKSGAFPGAFVFTVPNVGNLLTASAIGNCETSVYVVLVSRMKRRKSAFEIALEMFPAYGIIPL